MSKRALRHYYRDEEVKLEAAAALGDVVEPWTRHRRRLLDALASLSEEQWSAPSRCAAWTNRDVIVQLIH